MFRVLTISAVVTQHHLSQLLNDSENYQQLVRVVRAVCSHLTTFQSLPFLIELKEEKKRKYIKQDDELVF